MKKYHFYAALVCILMIASVACFSCAEAAKDYAGEFDNMSLEELQEIYDQLAEIINRKRIGNAKLFVDPSESRIAIGKNQKLTVNADERKVTQKTKLTYESSNPEIAKVSSNGTVTGVAEGKATIHIMALFEDKSVLETTAVVSVYVPVTAIKAPQKTTAFVNQETNLMEHITVTPENATEKKLRFSVDNETVASVSEDGVLKGLTGGQVTVTITSEEQTAKPKTAKVVVTINEAVSDIKMSKTSFTLGKAKTEKIKATVLPATATNKAVTWTSANPSVATVSADGVVTGKSSGTTTITCTSKDGSGVSASAKVTVITAVSSITAKSKIVGVIMNTSERVEYTIAPKDATNKSLNWRSSNASIATVSDNGTITGKSTGQCTVTATAADGSGASITLTVYVEPVVPVEVRSIHWQTTWGVKNGKMGVYGTNLCNYRRIKSFECTVECSSAFGNSVTTSFTYSGPLIGPGKNGKSKLSSSSVSGFANAYTVSITVNAVTFDNGTRYVIPASSRYSTYFSP